jgi:hypothetical protein
MKQSEVIISSSFFVFKPKVLMKKSEGYLQVMILLFLFVFRFVSFPFFFSSSKRNEGVPIHVSDVPLSFWPEEEGLCLLFQNACPGISLGHA